MSGDATGGIPPAGCPHTGAVLLGGGAMAEDPHALYAGLRAEHGPVAPVELEPGVEAWLLLGYQELLTVARDEERFSKDSRRWRALVEGRVAPDSRLLPMMGWRPTVLYADGDAHIRLRGAVADTLNRVDQQALRLLVQRVAAELIDEWCETGRADLLADYARRLPLRVFTRLLGVPDSDGPRLIDAITHFVDSSDESHRAGKQFEALLTELLAHKKADPGEDLASWLLHHPARLTDAEVLHHLVVILVAGNETTINWTANTLRLVLTDDRFRTSLSRGRFTVSDALEEVLWRDPPTQNFPGRWAVRDTLLGGRRIRAGDALIFGLAAANADPAVRPADPSRTIGNRSHLAWGAGRHSCPAQSPARGIVHSAVETVLRLLPDIRLAVDADALTWRPSPWSRALTALPAVFTPTAQGPDDPRTDPRLVTLRRTQPEGTSSWTPNPAALSASAPSAGTSTRTTPGSGTPPRRLGWNSLARFRRGR
ncbi:cytochrome P450 [Streptomyces meridianus]|uniref:Cytochrome P450 n=1 Tax=Streptomyces meridianus TaxID=2938945 RepID=A0ABT0XBM1_9ACTN|nr:cytochrome P450 [Streptomyces meridianus]MCM2579923.1 cytochrome P450 [Streptomyces meridianus]